MKVEYTPHYGIAMPQEGWVPAPRYLMRRDRVLDGMPNGTGKNLLEIGCGAGALISDFRKLGYRCSAIEISEKAIELAKGVHQNDDEVEIFDNFSPLENRLFDVIVSCEVIEHIDDHQSAIKQWVSHLKPGGLSIISAPSNPEKWNASDVWAGHFRRYTKETLSKLCESVGLEVFRTESYGYPLINFTDPIHAWINSKRMKESQKAGSTDAEREAATKQSGTNRSIETKIFPFMNNPLGKFAFTRLIKLQRRYLDTEKGNGIVCWAKKCERT